MESNLLISFIIPAYNVADTLSVSVQSIVGNSDSRIEVIIVENGSTDQTTAVAKELTRDIRVKLVHSDKGVSNARNIGIKEAVGTWICFVDADDFIVEGKMNQLILDAESSYADMILYGHCVGNDIHGVTDTNNQIIYSDGQIEDARITMLENPTRYMQAWAKLIRRSVVVENNIMFDNRLRLSEDSDFVFKCTKHCQKIIFSPECIYRYSLNPLSTMRVIDGSKARDYEYAMNITAQSVVVESEKIKKSFQKYVLMHMNILMVREIFNVQNKTAYKEKFRQMLQIIKKKIFKDAIESIHISDCKGLRMLPILMLKARLFRCASIVFIIRAKQNYKMENNTT